MEDMRMTLDERLENVAVLGAAGKMGSGIVLLLAQEMALLKAKHPDKSYHLYAVDVSEKSLDGLMDYLRAQATKAAEKKCVMLREVYKDRQDLVENYDIIHQYTIDVLDVIRPMTELDAAKDARMIFEAIVEDVDTKLKILKYLKTLCSDETFYFTNTSSIPIHVLDEGVGLKGHIIGYHFYNPPAVQKLAELIPSEKTTKSLVDLSHEIGKRLRKTIIPSNDVAGFIGNGHFMRDILHAIDEVNRLSDTFSRTEGIYALNRVSQDFLVRPMGIFQLIDYVGVEVCQLIMRVMTKYIPEVTLRSELIDKMVEKGVLGGQFADGSQKDGFLKYEKSRPMGVYDIDKGEYVPIDESWTKDIDAKLGSLPDTWRAWRMLLMDPTRGEKLDAYFNQLNTLNTLGAELAIKYARRSKEIGMALVDDGVAHSPEDVNGVLCNGFYHLYGPINDYVE